MRMGTLSDVHLACGVDWYRLKGTPLGGIEKTGILGIMCKRDDS